MVVAALNSASAGALFGAALMASGVHHPAVILDQLRLHDFRMMHVFLVAMGSSAFVIPSLLLDQIDGLTTSPHSVAMYTLEKSKQIPRPVRSNTALGRFGAYDGNLIGGMILGVGMALSGACPGTVLVQLAHGVPSARTVAIGALVGAAAHVRFGHLTRSSTCDRLPEQRKTLQDVVRVSDKAVYLGFGTAIAGVLYFTQALPGNFAVLPIVGGALIGAAQTASILLTGNPVGVSAGYEQASRYILQAVGLSSVEKPSWPPKALVFSLGIFVGALTLSASSLLPTGNVPAVTIPTMQAFLGGFAIIFGARCAGGCTSGHGISGLSALSLASLISVAGMFGAGIATRLAMDAFGAF